LFLRFIPKLCEQKVFSTGTTVARLSVTQSEKTAEGGSGRSKCRYLRIPAARKSGEKFMTVITWIVLGLIAGLLASKIVNRTGAGIILDILIGIIGALVGGFLFESLGWTGVTGFNIWSIFVAFVGAVILLLIVNLFRRTD
jgi:uncharacterized membrane protein YeaQ/YmgE (transglycosylase-associated protein family)